MPPLLIISNGHGEDIIALRIIEELQKLPECPAISVLPIVGDGHIYRAAGIPIVGRTQAMPSGGFIYMDARQLGRDLGGGLLGLTLEQYGSVRAWGKGGGKIFAVGDVVPLLFAWSSGADYAFMGTAKSEYYLRDEGGWLSSTGPVDKLWQSYYYPWERYLMSRPRCRAVFVRDALTAKILERWRLPVFALGNPMMDGLEFTPPDDRTLSILLLPGSRLPEAHHNWRRILAAVRGVLESSPGEPVKFLAALSPNTEAEGFEKIATESGFSPAPGGLKLAAGSLSLSATSYPEYLARCHLAIATAGTATEQVVGLGKPVITIPGDGPQFTRRFAELQTRLLGRSVIMVESPADTPAVVNNLLRDEESRGKIEANGKQRLGAPGASRRIARCLLRELGYSPDEPR